MASATITGSRYGSSSYGPFLQLHWNEVERDIAGNRTKVRLTLRFRSDAPGGINYKFYSRTGYLQGESYTYSGTASGTSVNLVLRQRDVWITHDSNGTKKVTFSGDIRNLGLTFSGNRIGTMSVSGSVTLTPIPRGSTLSAFSFASSLQIGTANTINYTVARHSSSYRHQIQLRDGSVTVAQWDNVSSNGSSTLSLTGTQVNTLLGRMSTVTSKTFTLRVSTRSGHNGGWIGSSVTRNASVSVNANVKPTISSTSATPIGNSWAVGKGFYVQGQTGVQAEFSSSARGGAGVKSRNISIGSLSSGGSVVGSVFRHSQTRLNTTGDITITYKITDTRGRSVSSTRTINVRAYTPPQITSFTVRRSSPTSPTVIIKSQGSIHGMGGQNTGTMTVTQQGVTGNVRSISLNNTTPSFNDSFDQTVATASSADFTITVIDLLGNSATSTSKVGTAFMEFSIRKGTGVGIGKVHEQGVLDVGGDTYFNGLVHFTEGIQSQRVPRGADLNDITKTGFYYSPLNSDVNYMINTPSNQAFALLVEETAGVKQTWTRYNRNVTETWMRQYYSGGWGTWHKIY